MCASGQKKGAKFLETPAGKEQYFEDAGDGRKVMRYRDKPAGAPAAPDNTNAPKPGTGLQPGGQTSTNTAGTAGSAAAGGTGTSDATVLTDNGITGGATDLQPGGNVSLGGPDTKRRRKGVIGLNI